MRGEEINTTYINSSFEMFYCDVQKLEDHEGFMFICFKIKDTTT